MSLTKFLQKISSLDPGNIYVENVRSVLDVSNFPARLICETAVMENLLVKKIGVVCPNDNRIIEAYDSYEEIPKVISCDICEIAEIEPHTFISSDLQKMEFYQLNNTL